MRRTETGAVQQIQEQQQNGVIKYDVQMSGLKKLFREAMSVLSKHGQVDDATRNSLELDEFDGARTISRASRRRGLQRKRAPGEKQLQRRRVACTATGDRMSEWALEQHRGGAPECSSA